MRTREAAQYLQVAPSSLKYWRAKGKGPRYIRLESRSVRYRRADLDAWVERCALDTVPNAKG